MAEGQVVERKLAAIFAADVAEYSRLMGLDELGTLRRLQAYRAILDQLIAAYRGRIFNTAGDSVVADFASAVDAVECAVAVQDAIAKENANRPEGDQMRFRIGVHLGDVIVDEGNLFGDGVNIAARLQALAQPGGICLSGVVRDQAKLDPLIDDALSKGWPLKRIDAILRAVLRAGSYELEHRKDVPGRVVVSEYVDVAHAFVDGDETGMVNAVLDQIARQFRADEFGRG